MHICILCEIIALLENYEEIVNMSLKSYIPINVMTTLYDQIVDSRDSDKEMFPASEWRKQGIYFKIKVSDECFGYDEKGDCHSEWCGDACSWFHVLMLNGHSVFTQITEDFRMSIPVDGWKNQSNHDSCYRESLGDLTNLGFDMHDKAYENMPEKEKKEKNVNKDDTINFHFDAGFSRLFKFVDVELKTNEENDYFYDVVSVTERVSNQSVQEEASE